MSYNFTTDFILIKFYKVLAIPVLMYGSENWFLNRSDKRIIEVAEMRFLRPMAGYTLLDKWKYRHKRIIRHF